jgi:hypothetical protein
MEAKATNEYAHEVRRHDGILGVAQNALHGSSGSSSHGSLDGIVARALHGTHVQPGETRGDEGGGGVCDSREGSEHVRVSE